MTTPTKPASKGFGARNWADVISGIGQGVGSSMKGNADMIKTKEDAREQKRRTLADILNRSMRRDLSLYQSGQNYTDETNDTQSQVMQQIARGFVDALRGSTRRG